MTIYSLIKTYLVNSPSTMLYLHTVIEMYTVNCFCSLFVPL